MNKKRGSFASNVKPLYYRFHIVYIMKDQGFSETEKDDTGESDCKSTVLHRVHYELMPYNNSLKVSIRSPHPLCIVPDVRSTIESVKSRRYPGITYSECILCPECVLKSLQPPATFDFDSFHDGACSKGHIVGSTEDMLDGKLSSTAIVHSAVAQAGRIVGEVLQDCICPKLFVVLPINLQSVSLKDLFVYSYLRDGFAVHLLCEYPEKPHSVDSPGFRVGKPKEFFEKYGNRVCKVLRAISTLSAPFKAAAQLSLTTARLEPQLALVPPLPITNSSLFSKVI